MRNHEILEKRRLLNDRGDIAEPGYAVSNICEYRREDIKVPKIRIKEWDYYLVSNDKYAVAFTVADNGYMGLLSVSVMDFDKPSHHTTTRMTFFPLGGFGMPSSSRIGDVLIEKKGCRFEYRHTNDGRHLNVKMRGFLKGIDFLADIVLSNEPRQSIVVATPFDKRGHFYYNQKINCFRAEGSATFGDTQLLFDKSDAVGMLDWGRGVWTYSNTWFWATASGYVDGVPFGLNLGYGFGDTSAASENAIIYDGIVHKIDDVDFGIPKSDKKLELMRPWKFSSSDNRLVAEFVPVLDRCAKLSALIVASDQHQVFGKLTGYAVLDDGRRVEFCNLAASAEVVKNRY